MSRKEKGGVPKLRFPGFRGEWNSRLFGEIYNFISTNIFSRDNLNYESGHVKNIHYGDIHTKFSTLFDITKEKVPFINSDIDLSKFKSSCFCLEGDIVFADASEDTKDVGKSIELINLNNEQILAGLHTILARQNHSVIQIGFGGYLFKSDNIRAQIQREAQGTKVFSISAGRLSNVAASFPCEKAEQKKIAACLTTLDNLISAESQKLDSLKVHKKGLMQNLFPAEGETVPKLRFPEFRRAGEWECKKVKDTFTIFQGYAFASNDSADIGVRWLKIADVGIQQMEAGTPSYLPYEFFEKYQKFAVKEGDYVMALTRPILNKQLKISPVNSIYDGALLNQRVGKLVTSYNVKFIYFLLQTAYLTNKIDKNIAGSEPPNLSAQQIEDIIVYIPPPAEQQKIATCLSTLDNLITAQSQKIDALKSHKKGLMQQLFPAATSGHEDDHPALSGHPSRGGA